jgi:hypothetical protein
MKTGHRLLVLVFSIAGVAAEAATPATILSYDDETVALLRALLLEQGQVALSAALPASIDELRMSLDKLDPDSLSPAGQRAYERVRERLLPLPPSSAMALTTATHLETSVEAALHTNTEPGETRWQDGYSDRLPVLALPLEAWIGEGFYADFDAALRQNHDGLNPALMPGNILNWTTDLDVVDTNVPQRAFIAFGGDSWSASLGRDRLSWGNGETGNLVLSDAPDFQDYARVSVYWPAVKYTALWILQYTPRDNYRAPLWGADAFDTTRNGWYPRNYFLHRLDFEPWDRLSFALMEGILIGGVPPDLVYLNPLMVYHDLFRWGHASSIVGLEVNFNPWRYGEVYGQAAFNQIQSAYEIIRYGAKAANTPDASSYIGGVRSSIPLGPGYLDVGGEAAYVGPWMYLRENELISYQWWRWMNSNVPGSTQWVSSSLGYWTGPDSVTIGAWAGYGLPGVFSVRVDYRHSMKGGQDFTTPYAEDAAAAALQAPSGTPELTDVVRVRGSWEALAFLRLGADVSWLAVDHASHVEGARFNDFQAVVSATFHWTF